MSESKSKPLTFKGIVAMIGAGLLYLISQVLGINIPGLTDGNDKGGSAGAPGGGGTVIEQPAERGTSPKAPTKEVAKETEAPAKELRDDTKLIKQLFQTMQSDRQVEAEGRVVHILPEDTDETPHQNFLLDLSNGITLKISHNTKVAPRIDSLRKGDTIRFHGEYEYNDKGGVVHWTHRTLGTRNKHPHGWLMHKGKKYE